MSRRTLARAAAPALGLAVAVAAVVPAVADGPAAAKLAIKGGPKFKANRYVSDTSRFGRDSVSIGSGGKVTLINRTNQPHTLSVVKRSDLPRNMRQMEACFGDGPCDDLFVAHGAVDPETGEEKEPDTPLVNVGDAGFDQPGDSVLIPPKGRVKVDVTSDAGKDLYFLCALHPWMQGKFDVK